MAIARKIAYNVVFNAAAKLISTVLALVGIGFITRYLGKEGFGEYSVVLAFFSFFGAFADLGLYTITARNISREGADEEKIVGNVLSLRIISSLSVLLFSPVIFLFLPYSSEVKWGILLSAMAFILSSTYSVLNGVFQKNLAMDRVATVELLGKVIQTLIIILAVKKDLGFLAIIFSLLAFMGFNLFVVFLLARKYIKITLRFDLGYWKSFLAESLPMGISVIITFLYFKLDTILLSVLKDSTQVGIYNAAYKVIENLTFFPAMIIGLMLPIMSHSIISDRKRFEYISNETLKVFLILVFPLVTGTLLLSDKIILLIAGEAFLDSANALRILIFALAFIFFGNFFNSILIAGNLQKKLMKALSFAAIFNISTNLILIPMYSYMGSAVVSVLTEFMVVAMTYFLAKKHLGFVPSVAKVWKIAFSAAIMGVFLYVFADSVNFFILAVSAACIYFASLFASKAIMAREILEIVSWKQK